MNRTILVSLAIGLIVPAATGCAQRKMNTQDRIEDRNDRLDDRQEKIQDKQNSTDDQSKIDRLERKEDR